MTRPGLSRGASLTFALACLAVAGAGGSFATGPGFLSGATAPDALRWCADLGLVPDDNVSPVLGAFLSLFAPERLIRAERRPSLFTLAVFFAVLAVLWFFVVTTRNCADIPATLLVSPTLAVFFAGQAVAAMALVTARLTGARP